MTLTTKSHLSHATVLPHSPDGCRSLEDRMWPTPVTCCTPGDMPQQKRWPKSALDFSGPVFLICERKTKQTLHASTLRMFLEMPVRKALGVQGCCCLGGWLRLTRVAVLCHPSDQDPPHQRTGLADVRVPHGCDNEYSRKSILERRDFKHPIGSVGYPKQHHMFIDWIDSTAALRGAMNTPILKIR